MFTRELIEAAQSMIDFYVRDKKGLNCDEPDPHTTATSLYPRFLSKIQTSTTLAKSTDLLIRYEGTATDPAIELVASIARASEPVLKDVIRMIPYTDPGAFLTKVLDYESGMSLFIYESFRWIITDTKNILNL